VRSDRACDLRIVHAAIINYDPDIFYSYVDETLSAATI
jgi:hypothetical protein